MYRSRQRCANPIQIGVSASGMLEHVIGSLATLTSPGIIPILQHHVLVRTVPSRRPLAMPGLRSWIRDARDRYWAVEYALEVVLSCPTLCIEAYKVCFTDYRGSDAKDLSEVPIPLGPRPRALTLPLSDNTPDQKTLEQSQSPLFTKLPLELRHRIYEYALGGAHMHLRIVDRRLLGARSLPLLPGLDDETETKVALAILRTCRIMWVLAPPQRRVIAYTDLQLLGVYRVPLLYKLLHDVKCAARPIRATPPPEICRPPATRIGTASQNQLVCTSLSIYRARFRAH
jgi:hypothetical protein